MTLSIVRSQTESPAVVPADWRELLGRMPDHVREAWEERAAIIEYDGLEPRPTAERRAFDCIVDQFEEASIVMSEHAARPRLASAGLQTGMPGSAGLQTGMPGSAGLQTGMRRRQ